MTRFFPIALPILFIIVFNACGHETSLQITPISNGGSDSGEYTGESLSGGSVQAVTFDSNNQAKIELGSVTDSSTYIVALYSCNQTGASQSFELAALGEAGHALTNDSPAKSLIAEEDQNVTEDLHEWLRNEESKIEPSPPNNGFKAAAVTPAPPELGSTRTYNVLNSFSGAMGTTTITAILFYKTSHALFYVDNRDASSLPQEEMIEILDGFEAIVEKERSLFGGGEADVDGDGFFHVLFTREVNRLGSLIGGFITGYYYAVDETDAKNSNHAEIIYISVPDPQGHFGTVMPESFALSNIFPTVLPHEYQHMINFNLHYFVNQGPTEQAFLNEALSHLAEDIYSMDEKGTMHQTGIENSSRVAGYLANIDQICFICGASLYQRGGSYLFLRYLYEQAEKGNLSGAASGREFLQGLLNTRRIGVDNIVNAALNTDFEPSLFKNLLGNFSLTTLLSDTGLTSDNYFEFDGISLRSAQNDNRGTVLYGPLVNPVTTFPFDSSMAGTSVNYLQLKGSDINQMGGSFILILPKGVQAGAYVVQTGL